MIGADDVLIEKYGRHIPPILGKQLVLKLIDQYLDNYHKFLKSNEMKNTFECVPSVERFHGAMLFVDISGFTALSQRLNVDELRIHINGYFKKILDLVFKFNGEVIKFAGDALFIIWQTKVTVAEGDAFIAAQYDAVAAATACGMEINQTCSHYKVSFFQQNLHDSLLTSALINARDDMPDNNNQQESRPSFANKAGSATSTPEHKKENSTFLNVHAGVSVGTMAGIDVGANDRWEYLLVGEPLVSVAKAESEAAVAELVLSPEAHGVLHKPDLDFMENDFPDYCKRCQQAIKDGQPIPPLPCGCQMTKGGFFKVNQTITGGSNLDADEEPDPEYELAFYAELMSNVTIAYDTMKPVIYECYNTIAVKQQKRMIELETDAMQREQPLAELDENGAVVEKSRSAKAVLALKDCQLHSITDKDDKLFVHYLHWIQNCIIDDLVRHVHEADRGKFTLRAVSRTGCLLAFAKDNLSLLLSKANLHSPTTSSMLSNGSASHSITHSSLSSGHSGSLSTTTSSMSLGRRSDGGDSFVSKIRNISNSSAARRKKKERHERTLQQDAALTAELRSVMVLFIKLDITGSLELYFDPQRPTWEQQSAKETATIDRIKQQASLMSPTNRSPRLEDFSADAVASEGSVVIEGYNFLKRTDRELEEDNKLLQRFQSCMEVMTKIFLEKGGQMRQFIVDDKGTVCIGTFGLRGSVNNDNAAAAIETAQEIIDQLADIGVRSGVGITSGKAYCGLVGSSQRHEYAVMGPSTNLSARLMAKSEWGEILCSEDARNRDRTHIFDSCGTIVAKGYEYPVPIFKPVMDNMLGGASGGQFGLLPPSGLQRQTSAETHTSGASSPIRVTLKDPKDQTEEGEGAGDTAEGAVTSSHHSDSAPDHPIDALQIPVTPKTQITPHADDHHSQHHTLQKPRFHTIGRMEEMTEVYAFLLPSVHFAFPDITYFEKARIKHSAEKEKVHEANLCLDLAAPTKLCIVKAANGVGKSNFVHSFTWHLKNLHRSDHSVNLSIFQNKSSSFNSSEPFGSWKNVMEQMMISIPSQQAAHGKTKHERIIMGLDTLVAEMSDEMKELKPLMSSIHHIKGLAQNELTNSLNGAKKLAKIAELLAALIQQYAIRTKNVIAIMMDDLQSMDSASWQLLKQLFVSNRGLLILGTFRPSNTASSPHSNKGSSASAGEMLNFFETSPDHYLRVRLEVFDEPTTWEYCRHLMQLYDIKGANETMFSVMHEIAGGNPLYLYEVTASFVERFKLAGTELDTSKCDMTSPSCTAVFSEMVKSFSTSRIEEVISYRFDQLDPSSQLLLKMASVVCANGARFSVALLTFMMQDAENNEGENIGNSGIFRLFKAMSEKHDGGSISTNQESLSTPLNRETFDVVATIKSLLSKNEFIKTASSGLSSSRGSHHSSSSGGSSTGNSHHRRRSSSSGRRPSIGLEIELPDEEPIGFDNLEMSADEELEYYGSLEFEFKVHLEQVSVYALMLNDQKESLHDRVASYLERKTLADPLGFKSEVRPSELFEEGFHWEHATNWSAAMTCYYKSASMLEAMGAFEENFVHLTAAYRMLNAMRRDAGVTEAYIEVPASFQVLFSSEASQKNGTTGTTVEEELVAMTPRSIAASVINRSAKLSPRPGATPVPPVATTLTKELIAKIFYNDSELLETGLNVTLRLAQASFSLSYNYFATSRLYEEALQMILLTWKDNIFLDHRAGGGFKPQVSPRGSVRSNATHGGHHPNRRASKMNGQMLEKNSPRAEEFGLTDPTICFPILTGISALYRNHRLKDDENHTKEATLYNLFLTLAQSSPTYRMHLIVGYCYKRSICFDLNMRQESIHLTDIVRHYYDHDLYSAEVARIYGNDRMPFTMAMNVQLLVMMGQPFRAKNYMFYIKELYPKIHHLHSMGITVLAIAPLLVQFGMPHKAMELFKMYLDGLEMRGAFSFFHESNPIFMVWLKLECLLYDYRQTKDITVFTSDHQCQNELSVMTAKYLGKSVEQRPVNYSALDSLGTSLELVCSKVCLLRASMWTVTKERSDTEIIANLDFAMKYINFNLECCEKESKLAFGYYSSLLTKAKILVVIASRVEKTSQAAEEEARYILLDAKECLLKCLEFGKKHDYPFICLSTGVFMETCGVDVALGQKIQLEYTRLGTYNTNGAALSEATVAADPSLAKELYFKIGEVTPRDNFDCLAHLFPLLEKFRGEVLPSDLQ